MGTIIGFVGWPCSGKDEAAGYLERVRGAQRFGHSDFIREHAKLLGIEIKKTEQLSVLFEERAAVEGYGWIAELVTARTLEVWSRDPKRLVVVTGVRHMGEVEVYRQFPGFHLVKLEADFEVRFPRWRKRPRSDGVKRTREGLRFIESLPGNANIPELMATPGITIINNGGDKPTFYLELDRLVTRLG